MLQTPGFRIKSVLGTKLLRGLCLDHRSHLLSFLSQFSFLFLFQISSFIQRHRQDSHQRVERVQSPFEVLPLWDARRRHEGRETLNDNFTIGITQAFWRCQSHLQARLLYLVTPLADTLTPPYVTEAVQRLSTSQSFARLCARSVGSTTLPDPRMQIPCQ